MRKRKKIHLSGENRVYGHQGEILSEGSQREVVRLWDPVGA